MAPDRKTMITWEPEAYVSFAKALSIFKCGEQLWLFVEYYGNGHNARRYGNANWKSDFIPTWPLVKKRADALQNRTDCVILEAVECVRHIVPCRGMKTTIG